MVRVHRVWLALYFGMLLPLSGIASRLQAQATTPAAAVEIVQGATTLPGGIAGDASVPFRFSVGFMGQSVAELRQKYEDLELQARSLSEQLRVSLPDAAKGEKLKVQLRDIVRQSFDTRQELHRAELAEFDQRLRGIQQSIEAREKIRQRIIDRRIEELVDKNLKWEIRGEPARATSLAPEGATNSRRGEENKWSDPAVVAAPPVPSDPSSPLKIQAVPAETLTWNLMGATFRVKAAEIASNTSIPTPDDATRTGQWLEAVHIRENGAAERAGLAAGDLLIAIDRQLIHTANDISRAWQDAEYASPSTVQFMRDGKLRATQLRWSSRLRNPNIEGKVLGRTGDQIEVLLGVDDGLYVGARLVIRSSKAQPIFHSAEVMAVTADTASARIVAEEKRFPVGAGDIASFGTGIPLDPPPGQPVPDKR